MFAGQLLFAQLMDFLPRHEFNACVRRYDGDRRLRGFSCLDQFLCMAFAQLTFRDSLRDIEICLSRSCPKLYHAGFRGNIARNTLADANRAHDWRIYADFAAGADRPSAETVCGRIVERAMLERPSMRSIRRRSTSVLACSLGQVSPTQGRREAAHPLGPAWQHPLFYAYFQRENARRQRPRPSADRAWGVLCHGSRLCRF